MNKRHRYNELVADRKVCDVCEGLLNPAVIADGRFDVEEVGPWTDWQGNLDAPVLLVGQDYSDVDYYVNHEGRERDENPTDQALVRLFHRIGITITPPGHRNGEGEVFFTNAVLCLKTGGMQGKVRSEWFRQCSTRFLRRQIEIVAPKVVVAMGRWAYRSVCLAFGLKPRPLRQAVLDRKGERVGSSTLFAVYHCGARVQNMTRSLDKQLQDWDRIKVALDAV